MKTEIIKVGDMYAARYKKWYHLRWRYIGRIHSWTGKSILRNSYMLESSVEKAQKRIDDFFIKIEKL